MKSFTDPAFPGPDPYAPLGDYPTLTVTSTDIQGGAQLPVDQRGERSISPQLAWSGAPEETKSYAITMYDPDAPTASGFWHWATFNIPASVTELPPGAGSTAEPVPGAVTLRGDSGADAYYGSQPPAGHAPHRYIFAVSALDVEALDVPADATPAVLGFNLHFHTLARGFLWGWDEN